MQQITCVFFGVSLVALTGWMMPAVAQESPVAKSQASQEAESTARGELVRVDTTAKTISIRQEGAAAPVVYSYSETTKVSGAGDNIGALSSMTGSPVTITFTKQAPNNMAVRVEVTKKST